MSRRLLARPSTIITVLVLQVVALMLFPAASFATDSQEWWLPALLAVMVLVADFQLIFRRNPATWPWHLIAFAQGFNIISRLMMIWAHSTTGSGDSIAVNTAYVVLSVLAMSVSAGVLWYTELPEVHSGLLRA